MEGKDRGEIRAEPVVRTLFWIEALRSLLSVPERLEIRDSPVGLASPFPTEDRIDFPVEKLFDTGRIFDRERVFAAAEPLTPILLAEGRTFGCLDDREILPRRDMLDWLNAALETWRALS